MTLVDQIARAVLYEGYILYPYRPSVKNQQRWTFGGIYPRRFSEAQASSDAWVMQAQCLIRAEDTAAISLAVRFLHLTMRSIEMPDGDGFHIVQSLESDGRTYQSWQEAVERQIELSPTALSDLVSHPHRESFVFPHRRTIEPIAGSNARLVREQHQIEGTIEWSGDQVAESVYRITARVMNDTSFDCRDRDTAVLHSFASTHMIINSETGGLISLTDPPAELKPLAETCQNIGCWPILVGEAGSTNTILASPIILSDYPQIAPESPGDLFDSSEIDEILTLRILTLTDEEKRQASAVDPMAADLMKRTEALAREQLMNLHGAVRSLRPISDGSDHV
ncbi:MAG: hypothetical protein JO353_02995 [Phycisphaerae bacterium]|nr:hypothetical protein [Phycisphaerae bacterium]